MPMSIFIIIIGIEVGDTVNYTPIQKPIFRLKVA